MQLRGERTSGIMKDIRGEVGENISNSQKLAQYYIVSSVVCSVPLVCFLEFSSLVNLFTFTICSLWALRGEAEIGFEQLLPHVAREKVLVRSSSPSSSIFVPRRGAF